MISQPSHWKALTVKEIVYKLESIKIKLLCSSKDIIRREIKTIHRMEENISNMESNLFLKYNACLYVYTAINQYKERQ